MSFAYRIVLLLFPFVSFAQSESLLSGKVVMDGKGLNDATILHYSSKRVKLTDSLGRFTIQAAAGDSLKISHSSTKDSIIVLSEETIVSKNILISMKDQVNTLDEAVVNYYPHLNAISLGIVQKKADPLTTSERRLRTAGDFKAIHLLSLLGGVLQTDPIINKINGKTNRLKTYIELEKKMESMSILKENYQHFMKEELLLSEEEIETLIWYFIEDKNYNYILEEGKESKIKFYLRDCWNELKNQ